MLKFPSDFAWGAATSGPQSEGTFKKKHQNVFDYWYANDPDKFYDGVGPDTASNFSTIIKKTLLSCARPASSHCGRPFNGAA